MDQYREIAWNALEQINRVILGKDEFVFKIMAALLAGGHILLEDLPGVGKTTLALAFSRVLGLSWNRVQFTPDVLPSDLTGFSIYRRDREAFVYQPGAVFCSLLLADEINRTSPKTQSALLEVMEEKQVTVDGVTRKLPGVFHVIATQNPFGSAGTQMLPPAQMDRFLISLSMGYPDYESELRMAEETGMGRRTDVIPQVMEEADFKRMQEEAGKVFIHEKLYPYIVNLMRATRENAWLDMGASPRGTQAMVRMARAWAWIQGEDFVSPGMIEELFGDVVRHRIHLSARARREGISTDYVLEEILDRVQRPVKRPAAAGILRA